MISLSYPDSISIKLIPCYIHIELLKIHFFKTIIVIKTSRDKGLLGNGQARRNMRTALETL